MEYSPHRITLPKSAECSRPSSWMRTPLSQRDSSLTLVDALSQSAPAAKPEEEEEDLKAKPVQQSKRSLTVLVIETTILVLAITTLGLSTAYAVQMVHAPLAVDVLAANFIPNISALGFPSLNQTSSLHPRIAGMPPSYQPQNEPKDDRNNWAMFYNCTMPLLSIVFAFAGIVFFLRRKISPIYSAIISASFLAGWCVNLGWWVACDWSTTVPGGNKSPKSCYQSRLIQYNGGLIGIDTALMNAKICFGILMVTAYATYLSASIFFPVHTHCHFPKITESSLTLWIRYLIYLSQAIVSVLTLRKKNYVMGEKGVKDDSDTETETVVIDSPRLVLRSEFWQQVD